MPFVQLEMRSHRPLLTVRLTRVAPEFRVGESRLWMMLLALPDRLTAGRESLPCSRSESNSSFIQTREKRCRSPNSNPACAAPRRSTVVEDGNPESPHRSRLHPSIVISRGKRWRNGEGKVFQWQSVHKPRTIYVSERLIQLKAKL